jgi:pimeloyl-ACP methyl ester carboxylesterase
MAGASKTEVTEHVVTTARHTTFYLAAGPEEGPVILFLHGWPDLSIGWRHQLPVFAGLGFRAIAPDMRGYGRSRVHARHEDYQVREIVDDMLELLDAIGAKKAILVGHDLGSPVAFCLATHHPERCHAVVGLAMPYIKDGAAIENLVPLIDRSVYPEAEFPVGQFDYILFYKESFEKARRDFEANLPNFLRLIFRRGDPEVVGQPALLAWIRKNGGWFEMFGGVVPELPIDPEVLTVEDLQRYVEGFSRSGMFGPSSCYMNEARNVDFAKQAQNGGWIDLPVLFLHAAYDSVCETLRSRLAEPMRRHCTNLTERVVESGHWMQQERPAALNAVLAAFIAEKLPAVWPGTVRGLR